MEVRVLWQVIPPQGRVEVPHPASQGRAALPVSCAFLSQGVPRTVGTEETHANAHR